MLQSGSFQPHSPVVVFAGTCQDLFDKVAVSENAFITGKPDTLLVRQPYFPPSPLFPHIGLICSGFETDARDADGGD